jgi:preprotein translocase subunit SecE
VPPHKTLVMSEILQYFKNSYEELVTKVSWPTLRELQGSAVLVFIASLIIAGIVFLMDWIFGVNATDSVWQGLVGLIYDIF